AYLDCSERLEGFGSATAIAEDIRRRVREERGLTVSIGVGANRLIAKIASDASKPDGLKVVKPGEEESFLAPLPVRVLPGVGPVMQQKLDRALVVTIAQVRPLSRQELRLLAGSYGETLYEYCRGRDDRPVRVSRERKSLSSERTYETDLDSLDEMDSRLEALAADVAQGLEKRRMLACTLTVKVRYADFRTVTRSRTLSTPVAASEVIAGHARSLLRKSAAGQLKVRLLGVGASSLVAGGSEQFLLFPDRAETG
ncbi:MAG: DNA polymerase IV, partial [Acidobacteriota bacterium]|nr:DNA polymerase IV [Acidobacteriota bacterium]